MQTTTTTKSEEVEACQARGYWFELVDPQAGDFYGPWLDATGEIEEYRYRHLARTGVALEVCRVERIGGPRVRVQNLERARRGSHAGPPQAIETRMGTRGRAR